MCSSAGLWTTQAICDGPNEVCEEGECFVTCEPWVRQFGSSESDRASDIVIDGEGNLYLVGWTSGVFNGDDHVGEGDIFLAKYLADRSRLWTRQGGTKADDSAEGVAIDAKGDLYVVGSTSGALAGNQSAGRGDAFVLKYSAEGSQQWIRQFGSDNSDWGHDIVSDGLGHVLIYGHTQGILEGNTSAGGRKDFFVAKFTTNGERKWIQQDGTNKWNFGFVITADRMGHAYVSGQTQGTFEGNSLAGVDDVFIARVCGDPPQTRR